MLGFGFNKTKVLAAAEKYVQQGKLQNAIAEYEKIIKADPKDITVLNTIGDLYARVGQVDSALGYFRMVGEHYASEGFTVKAIAMYKKLTKLNPSDIGSVQKLAELYTQQGLYNEARKQFMTVAEEFIKSGGLNEACKVFQKMLELDPESTGLQAKLADLYMKTGKKDEAKNIFLNAAESLHQRGTMDASSEALEKVLRIEPENARALLLKAQIAFSKGRLEDAILAFEKIPDLDSRPDALKSVLQSQIQLGKLEDAAPTARKLLNVHQDFTGLKMYADALLAGGKVKEAIGVYQEFSDQLIAADGQAVVLALNSYISRVKDDPSMLELINSLFEKAGDTSHVAEIKELLAHACVQRGDLARARDLYKELAEIEPENPLHNQNYKQILARMGEDSTSRELTSEEGSQALMVEELENAEVLIEQNYNQPLTTALETALTEADLYDSYNAPHKAVAPLESVLGRAPQDVRVNQRLAALYARLGRPADAAQRCAVLEKVFAAAGLPKEALKYGEMAAKYAEIAGVSVPQVETVASEQVSPAAPPETAPAFSIEPEVTTGKVEEFDFDAMPTAAEMQPTPPVEIAAPETVPPLEAQALTPVTDSPSPSSPPAEFEVPPPALEPVSHEIDLSDEWESMMVGASVEEPIEEAPVAVEPEPLPTLEIIVTPEPVLEEPELVAAPELVVEPAPVIESPVVECQTEVPASAEPEPEVAPVIGQEAVTEPQPEHLSEPAPEPESVVVIDEAPLRAQIDDIVEEIQFYISQKMWSEASAGIEKLDFLAPNHPALARFEEQMEAAAASIPAPEPLTPLVETPISVEEVSAAPHEPALDLEEPLLAAEDESSVLELEPEEPALAVGPEPVVPLPPPEPIPEPAIAAANTDVLADFVHDLDVSLGDDFVLGGKPASTPAVKPVEVPPVAPVSVPSVAAIVATPAVVPVPEPQISATATEAIDLADGTSLLQDLFDEFKEDIEESGSQTEDPETHYNLGVAFKEMGLLDEAIGELQKVSQAIDRGQSFSQAMQAYTWLANCFLEKGVPEASFKWYQKALTLADDEDTRTAINYELACAYDSAGMKSEALRNFMEVYSVNIDYRDVAERIKSLKQS
jgi:tetratricopeptide (TPR) repeat protein